MPCLKNKFFYISLSLVIILGLFVYIFLEGVKYFSIEIRYLTEQLQKSEEMRKDTERKAQLEIEYFKQVNDYGK